MKLPFGNENEAAKVIRPPASEFFATEPNPPGAALDQPAVVATLTA